MARRPPITRSVANVRKHVAAWHEAGDTVALVPTMGALHEGHLSLVRKAHDHAARVLVSIFVNPAQFAPGEDLTTYPRDEASDRTKLGACDTDLIYAPEAGTMYPEDFSTSISVGAISHDLCGVSRPHFFGGVATVVAKLFLQTQTDFAVFGEKDYQQLLVIRRMARDLDIPIEIVAAPIVREADGLAMSSRNAYLSAQDRARAPLIHAVLTESAEAIAAGRPLKASLTAARSQLTDAGFDVDYLEARNAETLALPDKNRREPLRVFAAARLGKTRLIDNVAVPHLSEPA